MQAEAPGTGCTCISSDGLDFSHLYPVATGVGLTNTEQVHHVQGL